MNSEVTLSTKCWEGDYRRILDRDVLRELFDPFGRAARRQVVLNRINDRAAAQERVDALVAAGDLDDSAWADDAWPHLAGQLGVPETWFGAAWPYSAPELTELAITPTPLLAHVAGDVRLEPGDPWLPRAVTAVAGATAVSPVSPSRIELVRPEARGAAAGWVASHDFSDQCFLARPGELLRGEVMRATHPGSGRYPKPGGALTFEARVGAWFHATGRRRLVDVTRGYLHPVGAPEGSSYPGLAGPREHLAAVPQPSEAYPAIGSVPGTAVVVARNAVRTIGWTVASLRWLSTVLVVDQCSDDGTAERAADAGATVRSWPHATVTGRAILGDLAADLGGWLVLVDADEVVPPRLAHALADLLVDDDVDAVEVARRSHLFGRPVHDRAHWPAYAVRALRADVGVFPWGLEAVRQPVTTGPRARVARLPAEPDLALLHLGAPDLHSWLAKVNERTSLEARGIVLPGHVTGRRTVKRFVVRFLRDRGYRDGRHGLRLAMLDALTKWLVSEKAWDNVGGAATAVLAAYDEMAAAIVSGEATVASS